MWHSLQGYLSIVQKRIGLKGRSFCYSKIDGMKEKGLDEISVIRQTIWKNMSNFDIIYLVISSYPLY